MLILKFMQMMETIIIVSSKLFIMRVAAGAAHNTLTSTGVEYLVKKILVISS